MVSINLMPEELVEAHRARGRARNLCRLLLAVGGAAVSVFCGEQLLMSLREAPPNEAQTLTAEVQSLRGSLESRRLRVKREEIRVGDFQAVRAAKRRIIQRITDIPNQIPPHVTLSSLHVTEHRVVLTGVASVRSDIGALVRALKVHAVGEDVSIERLSETQIERLTLHDFTIRAIDVASRPSSGDKESGTGD